MSAEQEGEDRGEVKRRAARDVVGTKSKHHQQTYRDEWESDPSFTG